MAPAFRHKVEHSWGLIFHCYGRVMSEIEPEVYMSWRFLKAGNCQCSEFWFGKQRWKSARRVGVSLSNLAFRRCPTNICMHRAKWGECLLHHPFKPDTVV